MTDQKPNQTGNKCPPSGDPAGQPKPPGGSCEPWKPNPPPKLDDPKPCPDPDPDCNCPPKPGSDPNCLDRLIDEQAKLVTAADKVKTFKADLEALLAKAKAASGEYTPDKYDNLRKEWVKQDGDIAELIRKLVCAVPCWRCIIECYVCGLLNGMHDAEQRLYGDGTLYSDVHSLYDLRYWWERERDARQRRFDRIKGVLAAWEKPAQSIEKALADDAKAIADANKNLGSDAAKVVYDVFFRLVPMHLAIAPPDGSGWTTAISSEYTKFCGCDEGEPDDCCGPDVGKLSFRQQLIGPQAYLIDPGAYFGVICCLVENRYGPAKDALAEAEAGWQDADSKIKRYKALVDNGIKTFDKDAKAAIPSGIQCDGSNLPSPETNTQQSTAR